MENVFVIDMHSNKKWAKSMGINLVFPKGTHYEFSFSLIIILQYL